MAEELYDAPDYIGAMRRNLFPSWSSAPPYQPNAQPAQPTPSPIPQPMGRPGPTSLAAQAQQFAQNAQRSPLAPFPQGQATPAYGLPGDKSQDRLPYEEPPQQAPQDRKAGREDVQQPQADPNDLSHLITPEMKIIIRAAVQRDPSLMQKPAVIGAMIQKMTPFLHKQQQEKYAAAKQAHTERTETMAQERADRAERLEQYKYLHDRERYVTQRMDKAWDRIKVLSDQSIDFAGDRKAELAKQQGYLKTYEDQLQSVVNDSHNAKKEVTEAAPARGEGMYAKGQQGRPEAPEAAKTAAPRGHEGPPQIFQLQADDIDNFVTKVKPALLKAKTLAEKELIIRNTFDHINRQLQADGKDPLSFPDANKLLIRFGRDAYDPRTTGQKINDWVSDSVKAIIPDYEESELVKGDLGFAARFYGNMLDPATYETMLAEGVQTAADVRPTTEQMLTNRARSGPERLLGGMEALGGALGPVGMATAPGASAIGQSIGSAVNEQTENPWLGLLAGGLAGGGAGAMRGGGMRPSPGAMAPSGPVQPNVAGGMSGGGYSNPMQGMMGGKPFAPSTPGAGGSMPPMQNQPVQGMRQLPPPSGQPMRSNVGPMPGRTTGAGETVRPKAGLYGQPAFQGPDAGRAIPMPDPSIRMPAPKEPLRLPPPTREPEPVDPVSRAEAAADIATGQEHMPTVEKPSRIQTDVTQFGDHAVGDTIKYRGKERIIEELMPKTPGNMAPKARLSGLKGPVTLTALEPVSASKGFKYAEGDRVKWDLPAGFGTASGVVQKITTSAKGRAMATVKRSDGQSVVIAIDSLKNV